MKKLHVLLLILLASFVVSAQDNNVKLYGPFTINDDGDQVYFAPGNLQYQPSTGTWRFAERQIHTRRGENAKIIAAGYEGWIDLFGWGTGSNPTLCSNEYGDYMTFNDWGNNTIKNGGNMKWRTLTIDEFVYIFKNRNTSSGIRYVHASVDDVNGVVLLPDNWNDSYYYLDNSNNAMPSRISRQDWVTKLESNGAAFLPTMNYNGSQEGQYWSATRFNDRQARFVRFSYDGTFYNDARAYLNKHLAVRLVCDARDVVGAVNQETGAVDNVVEEPIKEEPKEQSSVVISDDFDDGVINPEYWVATESVYENGGTLVMAQENNDANVALTTVSLNMDNNKTITIDREANLHMQGHYTNMGSNHFYGKVSVRLNGNDQDHITIVYYNADYEKKYGTYIQTKINGVETEELVCDILNGFWFTEKLVVDVANGTVSYYRYDKLIKTIEIDALKTYNVENFTVRFDPYGWKTGHKHSMDYVNIVIGGAEESAVNVDVNESIEMAEDIDVEDVDVGAEVLTYGVFTVDDNGKKVCFSQGNLQYQASTNTWRFAEHQLDMMDDANNNISPSYDGWIDLFGWGTGNNPTMSSTNSKDYSSFSDWGNNKILNGGGKSWFTLTRDEWVYLFNTRNTSSGIRYAKARVNEVNGVILLPDNWSSGNYSLNNTDKSYAEYGNNRISQSDWTSIFEANGAVFLPAAGYRYGTGIDLEGFTGRYWASTYHDSDNACSIYFSVAELGANSWYARHNGHSVRLVSLVE